MSDEVFCAGMAYVALSRVKQLKNLHLIAFQPESIKASPKCLHEINRLRQTYRPDLPQYTVKSNDSRTQKKKRKLTAHVCTMPDLKKQKVDRKKRKADTKNTTSVPYPKHPKTHTKSHIKCSAS